MRITQSAHNINAITNHPVVRPLLGEGDWFIDMNPVVSHEGIVSYDFNDGYLLFDHRDGSGTWEVHCAFAPEAWGYRAYNCAREAITEMFKRDDVKKIKARPPKSNTRTARFCQILGFTHCGSGKIGGAMPYEAEIFTMTKGDWSCLHT